MAGGPEMDRTSWGKLRRQGGRVGGAIPTLRPLLGCLPPSRRTGLPGRCWPSVAKSGFPPARRGLRASQGCSKVSAQHLALKHAQSFLSFKYASVVAWWSPPGTRDLRGGTADHDSGSLLSGQVGKTTVPTRGPAREHRALATAGTQALGLLRAALPG